MADIKARLQQHKSGTNSLLRLFKFPHNDNNIHKNDQVKNKNKINEKDKPLKVSNRGNVKTSSSDQKPIPTYANESICEGKRIQLNFICMNC